MQVSSCGVVWCMPFLCVCVFCKVNFYDFQVFVGDCSVDTLCELVYADLKEFCARQSLELNMVALTKTLLGFPKSSSFPTGWPGKIMRKLFLFQYLSILHVYAGVPGLSQELVQRSRHNNLADLP